MSANKSNNCSAYMLFYVRDEERATILEAPSQAEVPQHLIDKFKNEMIKLKRINQRIDKFSL